MTAPLAPPKRKDPLKRTRQPVPLPARRSRAAQGLTRAAADGRFALQACADCGNATYPARDACPRCLSAKLVFRDMPAGGMLLTETAIHVPIHPFFRERAPWRIGIVKLDCGPSVVAHLHSDCGEGEPVRMTLKLDKSGQATAFALPATDTPNMLDDRQLREFISRPKYRRVLVTDGRTPAGQAIVRAMMDAGAAKVFVGIGDPWKPFPGDASLRRLDGVDIVPLDATDESSVRDLAADIGGKVDILVNTVEHIRPGGLLDRGRLSTLRDEIDVAVLGLARLAQAFGPAMRARGADGINNAVAWVNLLSVYALANWPAYGTYSASQAACLSLSQSLRAELRSSGVRVVNVFSGPLDTEWFQTVPPPKVSPSALAKAVVKGLETGIEDLFVGDVAEDIRVRLAANPKAVERELAE